MAGFCDDEMVEFERYSYLLYLLESRMRCDDMSMLPAELRASDPGKLKRKARD